MRLIVWLHFSASLFAQDSLDRPPGFNSVLVRSFFRYDATLFLQNEAWIAMQLLGCRVWRGLSRWKRYCRGLGRLRYLALRRLDCFQCTLNARRGTNVTSFLHNWRSSVISAIEPLSRRGGL